MPFVINADFLLTSAREAVQEDEPWNKWLRDCVADTFVGAFEAMVAHQQYRTQAYRYLPLSPANSFLLPACEAIYRDLSKRACVWTEGAEPLRQPAECATAEERFRTLFVQEQLPRPLTKRPIVKPEITKWGEQLQRLGVKKMTTAEVLDCLKDAKWLRRQTMEWFVDCYGYLRQFNASNLEGILECRIVPVEKGRLSCDNEQAIYFECDAETRELLDSIPRNIRSQVQVTFLRSEFYRHVADNEDLRAWMTETLSVYPFSHENYIVDVSEWLINNATTIEDDELVGATHFLAAFCDDDTPIGDRIRDLPVVLNDGSRALLSELRSRCQHIVTPAMLDPESGWQLIYATANDRNHLAVLADVYVPKPAARLSLLRLLKGLGITDTPKPVRRSIGYWQQHQQTAYEKLILALHAFRSARSRLGDMKVENTVPPQWLEQSGHGPGKVSQEAQQRNNAILGYLRKLDSVIAAAPDYSREHTSTEVQTEYGLLAKVSLFYHGLYWYREPSEFLVALREKAWLVSTKGVVPPQRAFVDKPETREIFGDSVAYALEPMPERIADLLGIRRQVTAEELLEILAQNVTSNADNPPLARRVYQRLNSLEGLSDAVLHRLKTEAVIFAPLAGKRWVTVNESIWSDRSGIFGDGFAYLEKLYPKLKDFFVDTLGVKVDADAECFARRWLALQDDDDVSPEYVQTALAAIYRELLPLFGKSESTAQSRLQEEPEWWNDFTTRAKIWCQDGLFCEPADNCFVPDDGEVRRLFDGADVHFVWRPDKASFSGYQAVYRVLNVPYLSEVVTIALADNADAIVLEEPRFVTTGAKLFALVCLKERYPDEYERAASGGLVAALWNTTEAKAEHLALRYMLGDATRLKEYSAYWDRAKGQLLHLGEHTRKIDVAESLARELLSDRRFRDFAALVEAALGESLREAMARIRKWGWTVPVEVRSLIGAQSSLAASAEWPSDDEQKTGRARGQRDAQTDNDAQTGTEAIGEGPATEESSPVESDTLPGDEEDGAPKEDQHDQEEAPIADESASPLRYAEELHEAFNKPSRHPPEEGSPETDGNVSNPERRRKRTRADIHTARGNEPPLGERFDFVKVRKWEGKNHDTRFKLQQWYGGRCQICGLTFAKRNGEPYFEGLYLVSRIQARWIDRPGNVLCLCANCCAKFQHGSVSEMQDIRQQIKCMKTAAEGGHDNPFLEIILCGEAKRIVFAEKHLVDLQELLGIDTEA